MRINIIGAGLAGCEAALYLAKRGVPVTLYEQKPHAFSPAHHSAGFAELVCSNSLKAERRDSASGLLKAEMELLGLFAFAGRARVQRAGGRRAGRGQGCVQRTRHPDGGGAAGHHRAPGRGYGPAGARGRASRWWQAARLPRARLPRPLQPSQGMNSLPSTMPRRPSSRRKAWI